MVLVVVMGVSGSGKSTVGSLLADKLSWKFYEGDDYHPEENRKKMAEGIPLTDQDRIPWLCHLHDILMRAHASGQNVILACSALKKLYRCILEKGEAGCQSLNNQQEEKESTPRKILFVHLAGPIELIASRLEKRRGHFMPPSLLQSQFDTLEPPRVPENFITVNLEKSVSEIVSDLERHLRSLY
ncbi:putative gluconokinase isoform 1-T1 [Vipera latastei]